MQKYFEKPSFNLLDFIVFYFFKKKTFVQFFHVFSRFPFLIPWLQNESQPRTRNKVQALGSKNRAFVLLLSFPRDSSYLKVKKYLQWSIILVTNFSAYSVTLLILTWA